MEKQTLSERVYRCKPCEYCLQGTGKKDMGRYFCTLRQYMNVLDVAECPIKEETKEWTIADPHINMDLLLKRRKEYEQTADGIMERIILRARKYEADRVLHGIEH